MNEPYIPAYIALHRSGELRDRVDRLLEMMDPCILCPRGCRVRRLEGAAGYCGGGSDLKVSSAFPHFGEEAPLSGIHGSGTVFFAHCNLLCMFCQNYDISHFGEGSAAGSRTLAGTMMSLQKRGCHNINLVTPTHYVPHIVDALDRAAEMGLSIPIVYNCGGYESREVLELLDGVIDIYMPDAKFSDSHIADTLCHAADYPAVLKIALKEMHRQVGPLVIDERGIAQKGLLIRHLVLPGGIAGTEEIVTFVARFLSTDSYVNIMGQYHPCFNAVDDPVLRRRISVEELGEAVEMARSAGLSRGFQPGFAGS
jgi:putative pyruvate formate lyase activating enzyme